MFNNKSMSEKESSIDTKNELIKIRLPCNNCGAINNIELNKLDQNPGCGNCKTKIVIADSPVNGSNNNFEKEVLKWPGIVLVDFWATWCPPCKMIAPVLESISKEKKGEIKIVKVNVDQESMLSGKYQISSIPTLILFVNGHQVNRVSGALPKKKLLEWIYSSV